MGSGELKVRFPDGSGVDYRSMDEMVLALNTLRRERAILISGGVGVMVKPQWFGVRPYRGW
jgi:hypothetical protein